MKPSLISTTAISSSATSASVIYSNTSRSNVAFRVVGFIDITEATAGTWATAPTLVQGCGGQAPTALSSLGYGQTMQNLSGSRTPGTTYYNTTGRRFFCAVAMNNSATSATIIATVNGQIFGSTAVSVPNVSPVSFIVPPGGSYVVAMSGGTSSINSWVELR